MSYRVRSSKKSLLVVSICLMAQLMACTPKSASQNLLMSGSYASTLESRVLDAPAVESGLSDVPASESESVTGQPAQPAQPQNPSEPRDPAPPRDPVEPRDPVAPRDPSQPQDPSAQGASGAPQPSGQPAAAQVNPAGQAPSAVAPSDSAQAVQAGDPNAIASQNQNTIQSDAQNLLDVQCQLQAQAKVDALAAGIVNPIHNQNLQMLQDYQHRFAISMAQGIRGPSIPAALHAFTPAQLGILASVMRVTPAVAREVLDQLAADIRESLSEWRAHPRSNNPNRVYEIYRKIGQYVRMTEPALRRDAQCSGTASPRFLNNGAAYGLDRNAAQGQLGWTCVSAGEPVEGALREVSRILVLRTTGTDSAEHITLRACTYLNRDFPMSLGQTGSNPTTVTFQGPICSDLDVQSGVNTMSRSPLMNWTAQSNPYRITQNQEVPANNRARTPRDWMYSLLPQNCSASNLSVLTPVPLIRVLPRPTAVSNAEQSAPCQVSWTSVWGAMGDLFGGLNSEGVQDVNAIQSGAAQRAEAFLNLALGTLSSSYHAPEVPSDASPEERAAARASENRRRQAAAALTVMRSNPNSPLALTRASQVDTYLRSLVDLRMQNASCSFGIPRVQNGNGTSASAIRYGAALPMSQGEFGISCGRPDETQDIMERPLASSSAWVVTNSRPDRTVQDRRVVRSCTFVSRTLVLPYIRLHEQNGSLEEVSSGPVRIEGPVCVETTLSNQTTRIVSSPIFAGQGSVSEDLSQTRVTNLVTGEVQTIGNWIKSLVPQTVWSDSVCRSQAMPIWSN